MTTAGKREPARTYCVYVIELDREVLENRKFREANPDRREDKPCVYVGMTGRTPELRFEQHRAGKRANRFVKRFGVRLRPRLYARYNPMTREEAAEREVALARRLRRRGYAVWQN